MKLGCILRLSRVVKIPKKKKKKYEITRKVQMKLKKAHEKAAKELRTNIQKQKKQINDLEKKLANSNYISKLINTNDNTKTFNELYGYESSENTNSRRKINNIVIPPQNFDIKQQSNISSIENTNINYINPTANNNNNSITYSSNNIKNFGDNPRRRS